MADYRELAADFSENATENGITATRAFIDLSGGPDTLPDIGASYVNPVTGTTVNNCKLRSINKSIFVPDGAGSWSQKYVCNYSTKTSTAAVYGTENEDERQYSIGGEIITLEKPTNWTWTDTSKVSQPIYLSNVMGTITRSRTLTSAGAKTTFIQSAVIPALGKINSKVFEDFRIGSVLFEGISGGTQNDSDGDVIWVFNLNFSFRIITAAGGKDAANAAITQNDWLYVWNKNGGGTGVGSWDLPKDANTKYLYEKSDFDALF